ncbi:MAG: hypothetical protein ACI4R7_08375 [Oliverpabstia sp.]
MQMDDRKIIELYNYRSENAKYDSYYVVLTSNANLSFEDVDRGFGGSYLISQRGVIIVEYGLIG